MGNITREEIELKRLLVEQAYNAYVEAEKEMEHKKRQYQKVRLQYEELSIDYVNQEVEKRGKHK